MVFIIAAILIFGVLIAVHELGHFLAAKLCGVQVNEFSVGMGPAIFHRTRGETEYSLRLLPLGGYCAMEGEDEESDNPRALNRQGFWRQFFIFVAGAAMNFLTGLLIILCLYAGAQTFYTDAISGFAPGFPQEGEDGLMEGDLLYRVDGYRTYLHGDASLFLSYNDGQGIDLEVIRDGERVVLKDFPLYRQTYTGTDGESYEGFGLYVGAHGQEATLGNKLKFTWNTALGFVQLVRFSLVQLVTGGASVEDLSGPVGIVTTITQVGESADSTRAAVENVLYFAALIAINLAVMNLLPLPALDGGKVLFLAVNTAAMALFKRRIPEKYESFVHAAGFVLLMGLMAVVTFHDIVKLFR